MGFVVLVNEVGRFEIYSSKDLIIFKADLLLSNLETVYLPYHSPFLKVLTELFVEKNFSSDLTVIKIIMT